MKATLPTLREGDACTFTGGRLSVPTLRADVAGRGIFDNDQTGTLQLFSHDRVRVVEFRGDNYALVSHAALKGSQLLLCPVDRLAVIEAPKSEDAAL